MAVSQSASAFTVAVSRKRGKTQGVYLYDRSGAGLGSVDVGRVHDIQFTRCGKYFVVSGLGGPPELYQYDVASMSCVRELPISNTEFIAISPCSRVFVSYSFGQKFCTNTSFGSIRTEFLYPHKSELGGLLACVTSLDGGYFLANEQAGCAGRLP